MKCLSCITNSFHKSSYEVIGLAFSIPYFFLLNISVPLFKVSSKHLTIFNSVAFVHPNVLKGCEGSTQPIGAYSRASSIEYPRAFKPGIITSSLNKAILAPFFMASPVFKINSSGVFRLTRTEKVGCTVCNF